jgi:hypothetical protein
MRKPKLFKYLTFPLVATCLDILELTLCFQNFRVSHSFLSSCSQSFCICMFVLRFNTLHDAYDSCHVVLHFNLSIASISQVFCFYVYFSLAFSFDIDFHFHLALTHYVKKKSFACNGRFFPRIPFCVCFHFCFLYHETI